MMNWLKTQTVYIVSLMTMNWLTTQTVYIVSLITMNWLTVLLKDDNLRLVMWESQVRNFVHYLRQIFLVAWISARSMHTDYKQYCSKALTSKAEHAEVRQNTTKQTEAYQSSLPTGLTSGCSHVAQFCHTIHYTSQVSSTSAEQSQSLRVLKMLTRHTRTHGRTDRHLTGFISHLGRDDNIYESN